MIRHVLTAAVGLVLLPTALLAQATTTTPPANPSTQAVKGQFGMVKNVLARTAEKVPEELYAFKPTPEVRSSAGVFGHMADGNMLLGRFAAGKSQAGEGDQKIRCEVMTTAPLVSRKRGLRSNILSVTPVARSNHRMR